MSASYSLAYLTTAPMSPPDCITLAAKLGYQAIGVRALPVMPGADFARLADDKALLRETKARMTATGVTVFDVEIIRLLADFQIESVKPFLEACGELGAKAILIAGDDPDEARMIANYAAFCEAAHPYGLTGDLEYMPWTRVHDANTALRVVTKAAQPNGGILVDALHTARSSTTTDDLRNLPRELLHYIQICDAPAEVPKTVPELLHTARTERLLPGHGGIDLVSMFAALPRDVPVSIEMPNDILKAKLGVEEWSRQVLVASRSVLAKLPAA
jgi:sugar phosphate isomerase/epimerase